MNQFQNLSCPCSVVLHIFDGIREPIDISLSDFGKQEITFGRSSTNDIILYSPFVSAFHGKFRIEKDRVCLYDMNSTNGLVHNGCYVTQCFLENEDVIRISGGNPEYETGVLMLITSDNHWECWQKYSLNNIRSLLIGRSVDCSIVLSHISVSKKHAILERAGTNWKINDLNSTNGVSVNGYPVENSYTLHKQDIIQITNTKIIFTASTLYYYTYLNGITLKAENITKKVKAKGGEITICNDVSLTIKPGELVAIVGGSGAGKTTLMNTISGYDKPTSGQVLINGDDLYESFSTLKSIIGYVPQKDIVYDNLTLFSMLEYSARLRLPDDTGKQERIHRVQEVIKMVELTGKESTFIRQLSGGQKKRASIAVELLSDPKLFFLDEPASGLDPGTEQSLMKTLKKMASSGKTVVLVTHSTLNLQYCDKIIFMGQGGNLCFYGNAKNASLFFQVNNLVDIYGLITENPNFWKEKYYQLYQTHNGPIRQATYKISKRNNSNSSHSWIRQTGILSQRYFHLIINDRQRLLMFLLQAPLLAYLISLVKDGTEFSGYSMTKSLLFALSCSSFWIGTLNSIQEICKEKTILKREYMAGLKLLPYLFSKYIVLGLLCLIQSAELTAVFCLLVGSPEKGIIFSPTIELFLSTLLTSLSASSMGIAVSALFNNPDRAMTIAPILLMPQLLFSGLLFELSGVTKYISWIVVCRWSMECYGSIAKLNELKSIVTINGQETEYIREAQDFFDATASHLLQTWGILLIVILTCGLISLAVIRNIKNYS